MERLSWKGGGQNWVMKPMGEEAHDVALTGMCKLSRYKKRGQVSRSKSACYRSVGVLRRGQGGGV